MLSRLVQDLLDITTCTCMLAVNCTYRAARPGFVTRDDARGHGAPGRANGLFILRSSVCMRVLYICLLMCSTVLVLSV